MTASNMGRPVRNKHNVPAKQWNRWSNQAKRVFNYMYHAMRPRSQWSFQHPKALPMAKDHWEIIRWNVAWTAANAADNIPQFTHIIPVNDSGKPVGKKRKLP